MTRRTGPWWLVLETDDEITRYYRWWVQRELGITLNKPSWKAHITVIEGTEPEHKHNWLKYANQTYDFRYGHDIRTKGPFYWLEVDCKPLLAIRTELGLPEYYPLHITVGRLSQA
jgi:hypothetical protein